MSIRPVTPIDLEKLVPTNASIIVDLTLAPLEAIVDGVQVFDGAFFQASWTGSLLNLTEGGRRLVLTPPAPFALEQVVDVTINETGGATVSYRFQVGIEQVTPSDDNRSPALTQSTGSDYYLSYIKDPGTMYVRFTNPLSPEIPLISASIVDAGFDPLLNKIVVLFVNNGNVYVTTANPGDGPNSIIPPAETQTPTKAVALPYSSLIVGANGGAGLRSTVSAFPRPATAIMVGLDPRRVRIARPTEEPEATFCVGFIPYKTSRKYSTGSFLPFVPLPAGASYAEFTDPVPTPFANYAAIAVYKQGQSTKLVYSALGEPDLIGGGSLSGADVHLIRPSGQGARNAVATEDFLPVKVLVPVDAASVSATSGNGVRYVVVQEDFLPLKVALPIDDVSVVVAGSGIRCGFGR